MTFLAQPLGFRRVHHFVAVRKPRDAVEVVGFLKGFDGLLAGTADWFVLGCGR